MSRWSDLLEKHTIHETIRQIREWLSIDLTDATVEVLDEISRIKKVLEILDETLKELDPELIPFKNLDALNNSFRHQSCWNQLNIFHTKKTTNNLSAANNHITNSVLPVLTLLTSLTKQAVTTGLVNNFEDTIQTRTEAFSSKANELSEQTSSINDELSRLSGEKEELEKLIEVRKQEADQLTSQWQQQFSDSQDRRSENYNDWKSSIDKDLKEQTKIITVGTQEYIDGYKRDFESVLHELVRESQEKHNSILELYQLSSGDSISGGYAQTANTEEKQANFWRWVSIGFIAATVAWLVGNYIWFNESNGLANCEKCITNVTAPPASNIVTGESPGIAGVKKEPTKNIVTTDNLDNKAQKSTEQARNYNDKAGSRGNIIWQKFLLNFSLIGVLLFGAGFSSRQSTNHRNEATRTRRFALQVKALDPYISKFDEKDQIELKKQLSEKFFTGIDSVGSGQNEMLSESAIKTLTKAFTDILKSKGG